MSAFYAGDESRTVTAVVLYVVPPTLIHLLVNSEKSYVIEDPPPSSGVKVEGQVALNGPAAGYVNVALDYESPVASEYGTTLTFPSNVTIAPGQTAATFDITVSRCNISPPPEENYVSGYCDAAITATYDEKTKFADLAVCFEYAHF